MTLKSVRFCCLFPPHPPIHQHSSRFGFFPACFIFLFIGMKNYLLLQCMFLLLQTDFFSTHQLQSLLRNCILKLFHTFHCCRPCCLTKFFLVCSHSIVHSYRREEKADSLPSTLQVTSDSSAETMHTFVPKSIQSSLSREQSFYRVLRFKSRM